MLTCGEGDFFIIPSIWYHSQANVTRELGGQSWNPSLRNRPGAPADPAGVGVGVIKTSTKALKAGT